MAKQKHPHSYELVVPTERLQVMTMGLGIHLKKVTGLNMEIQRDTANYVAGHRESLSTVRISFDYFSENPPAYLRSLEKQNNLTRRDKQR